MAAGIPLNEWEGKKETVSEKKTRVTVFYNLILGVTSHNFCHNILIRNKPLSPAYIPEEGIPQGHQCQEVIIGDHLRKLPTTLIP